MNQEIRNRIRDFLKVLLVRKDILEDFSDEASLFQSGKLSSLDVVQLIVFLEDEFGISFEDNSFNITKIDSVEKIDNLIVENKQKD